MGPLLFVLYVNDIPTYLSCPTEMFGDDTAIHNHCSPSSISDSVQSATVQHFQIPIRPGNSGEKSHPVDSTEIPIYLFKVASSKLKCAKKKKKKTVEDWCDTWLLGNNAKNVSV